MKFIIFFTMFVSSVSFAAEFLSKNCQTKLSNKQLEMNVISSNLANINTTRMPEGGPYNKQELVCKNNDCSILAKAHFTLKYEPNHIDADKSGHVQFPNISIEQEMLAMQAAAIEYEKIVTDCK